MSANIFGDRFYGNRVPAWHKLGVISEIDQTGVEALTAIGGGFWLEQRPIQIMLNGEYKNTGDFAIVRSPTPDDAQEKVFGYSTKRYKLLQPLDAIELFDEKVNEPCETLGFLGKGERMFITWKLPEFYVGKEEDVVQNYGFCWIGFDGIMGAGLNVTTVRVVCQNTWAAALNDGENNKDYGKGKIFSGKHTMGNLKYKLGEWMEHVQENAEKQVELAESFFGKLVNHPLSNDKEIKSLLHYAYPDPEPIPLDYPKNLRQSKQESIDAQAEVAERYRTGIYELFNGQGTAITPDMWGLFNATTEYFNYAQVAKKPVDASILFGNRARNMNKMAEVLQYQVNK